MRLNYANQFQMNPLMIAGAVASGLGSIGKMIFGAKQRKASEENPYQNDPYAKQQLGLAQNMFNARMGGATIAEQNIANAQANQNATINRNATDGAQALALASAAQGTANDGYNKLAMEEANNKANMLQNLNAAYQTMSSKYAADEARRSELLGAGAKNMFGGINDLGSMGIMASKLDWKNPVDNNTVPINGVPQVNSNMQKIHYFNPTGAFKSAWGGQ